MYRTSRRIVRQRRLCLLVTALAAAGLVSLIAATAIEGNSAAPVLVGLTLGVVGGVGVLFLLVDTWASRYAKAFEVGYRLRDLDDESSDPTPRRGLSLVSSRDMPGGSGRVSRVQSLAAGTYPGGSVGVSQRVMDWHLQEAARQAEESVP